MGKNLGYTELESDIISRDIFASNAEALQLKGITIASGQNLVRGTCLGKKTEDGKYYKWNTDASDGTQNLAGILGVDTDASEGDEVAFAWVTGDFNKSALYATASSMITAGFVNNDNVSLMISEEN
ncbi:head decoration protein [Bacteroidetes/Chlorobi group bacterium ChocPot_Mid]|nr:MAG: head decoration protein [Bacteroidetes/Chlorobi group bacterium ChocPot_Mid]